MQWRVDETNLVPEAPIKPGGTLTVDPMLDDQWWDRFDHSDRGRFGEQVDTTVEHWVPAHEGPELG